MLTALIQNVFVPGRGLYGFRGAGEIFPQWLHRREPFVEGYFFERKVEWDGGGIPRRWMDSNPKPEVLFKQAPR